MTKKKKQKNVCSQCQSGPNGGVPPSVGVRRGFVKKVILEQDSEGQLEVRQLTKGVGMKDNQRGSCLSEWSRAQFWCQADRF